MVAIAAPPTIQRLGIDMFPAGFHTDSSGRSKQWTTAELEEAAESYNSIVGTHDAPILIGHDGNTSYGWLKRAYVEGDRLRGDFDEVDPTFAENAKAGRYKKKSISFYPPDHPANPTPGKLNIRHLAIVGIPAIKGLASDFEAGDLAGTLIYDYAEVTITSPSQAIATVFRNFREWLIETQDLDIADRVVPAMAIDVLSQTTFAQQAELSSLQEQIFGLSNAIAQMEMAKPDENNQQNFGEQPMTTEESTPEVNDFQETIDAQAQEISRLKEQLAKMQKQADRATVQSFAEQMVSNRKITRDEVPSIMAIALQLDNATAVDFGEGGSCKTPRQYYLDSIAGRKELYSIAPMSTAPSEAPPEFGEVSRSSKTANFSEESLTADLKIKAYMTQHSCSYAEAVDQLLATDAI
jgi:hypothetical protein